MTEPGLLELAGTWVGVFLTLAVLSFLYKDNPFYRMAEHLFVGISAGYLTVRQFFDTLMPNLVAPLLSGLSGKRYFPAAYDAWWPVHFVGAALCVLMFARYTRKGWLARVPLALVVGAFAGINIVGYAQGDLVQQVEASMVPLVADDWSVTVSRIIVTIGLITTLLYFFFSKPHTGALGVAARTGILFMMVAFGASFGYTAMGRVALLFRRAQYLRNEDGPGGAWPVLVCAAIVVVGIVIWERRQRRAAAQQPPEGS